MEKRKLVIGGIYRPPEGCTAEGFPKTLEEIVFVKQKLIAEIERVTDRNKCIVFGDFNYGNIDWEHYEGPRNCTKFIECTTNCSLTQIVREPTRNEAILDLILTN